jgi:methylenetetrahydrofolate reductase (NADPH)
MFIKDILKRDRALFSFEIFPPKEDSDLKSVLLAVGALAGYSPDFISVTYGAGGGTSRNTAKIATHIQDKLYCPALAHLTCLSSTKEEVKSILDELESKGIKNILALRGDEPDKSVPIKEGARYKFATDLIREINERGAFSIGGACYPETHPDALSREDDIDNLKRKQDAGCHFLISQLFFNNDAFYDFYDRAAGAGVTIPIIPGIMPVMNSGQIKRMCALSGAALTPKFERMLAKYHENPYAMRQAGIAYATEQITDLLSYDVKGIHLYSMNKPDVAVEIKNNVQNLY